MPFYRISDMEAVRASVGPATAKTAPGELNIELQDDDERYLRTLEEVKKAILAIRGSQRALQVANLERTQTGEIPTSQPGTSSDDKYISSQIK